MSLSMAVPLPTADSALGYRLDPALVKLFSLPASKRFVVPLTGEASGSPSVLAASYADKIFRSTAQLWFEITVRHENR